MYELKNKIYALITLYNPSSENGEKIKELSQYVDRVFLCDNSGNDNGELFSKINNSIYINNGRNLGLSSAYNVVLKNTCYGWNSNDYIIFFDQDSSVTQKHIEKLLSIYKKLEQHIDKVGCLGPAYYNSANGQVEVVKGKKILEKTYEVNRIITSSMLVKYGTLKETGFFNDSVFLDYADWDLCWRLRKTGYKCFTTTATKINHRVGLEEKKIGPLSIRIWDPIRTYYQVRDGKYLLKQTYVPVHDRMQLMYMTSVLPKLNIKYLDRSNERREYLQRAIQDFKVGKTGAIEE